MLAPMPTNPATTEARIFVARMLRELRDGERAGAAALAPGATRWRDAFHSFAQTVADAGGPVKASKVFEAGRKRLSLVQKDGGCFVNGFAHRSRSGLFHVLTWSPSPHPLLRRGLDGAVVHSYICELRRRGYLMVPDRPATLAYVSWHTFARMYERSEINALADCNHVIGGVGIAGLLMRELPERHGNKAINYCVPFDNGGGMLLTGVLRYAANDEGKGLFGFFDVVTALPPNDRDVRMWAQGSAIALATWAYVKADTADPRGLVDDVPVLEFRGDDYATREWNAMLEKDKAHVEQGDGKKAQERRSH